jgi:exonuclease SbcD
LERLKIVHCADFHLDAPFLEGVSGGYGALRRQHIKNTFSAAVGLVISENADLMLIAGDLYEHGYASRSTIAFIHREIHRIPDVPVLIVPGNHDPAVVNSWYERIEWPINVHILKSGNDLFFLDKPLTQVFGLGFSQFHQKSADMSVIPEISREAFNILMVHGTMDMGFADSNYNPVESADLEATKYDYIAMGHFHQYFEKNGKNTIVNPGSPEPLGFDEPGVHGVVVAELSKDTAGVTCLVQRVPLSSFEYADLSVDISDCETQDRLRLKIAGTLQSFPPERYLVRLRLKGFLDRPIHLADLKQWLENEYHCIRIYDETQTSFDLDSLSLDRGLKGIFVSSLKEQIALSEKAGDAEAAEVLKRSMQLGLEALLYGSLSDVYEE